MIDMSHDDDTDDDRPRQESRKPDEPEIRLRELLKSKSECTPEQARKSKLDRRIADTKMELDEKIKRLEHQVSMRRKIITRLKTLRNSA